MSFLQCILFLIVATLINSITSSSTINIESTTQSLAKKILAEVQKIQNNFEEDEKQLKMDRTLFEKERQISESMNYIDVLEVNVGGEIITTTRQTLTKIPKSILSILFNGRWEHKLPKDQNGNIFLDFNSIVFRYLLDQLQIIDTNNSFYFYPPSQSSLIEPFKKMLRKLGLQQFLSSEIKNVITFNVGGQTITNRRTTFTQISNSTFNTTVSPSKITKFNNENDIFLDYDPKVFQHLINQLRKQSSTTINSLGLSSNEEKISFRIMLNDLIQMISNLPPISTNTKWKQNAMTIAGGHGKGNQLDQFYYPYGIYVDDNEQCIYIADWGNHRIIEWKSSAKVGQVVAGGHREGGRMDQLHYPTDVIVDKKTGSLIICDRENRRVVQWSRRNGTRGQTIISDIGCWGLTMDNNGDLYATDTKKSRVMRWKRGETNGTIVAGGNRQGDQFNQLNYPTYLSVDEDHSIYVSDRDNHRVMKWMKDAIEGIVVAGGRGKGDSLTQLSSPQGVMVDHSGNVYVADSDNHRILRWSKGANAGQVIVGGYGSGQQSNQFYRLKSLSFDRQGHLYVVDDGNNRVQKFLIDLNLN